MAGLLVVGDAPIRDAPVAASCTGTAVVDVVPVLAEGVELPEPVPPPVVGSGLLAETSCPFMSRLTSSPCE